MPSRFMSSPPPILRFSSTRFALTIGLLVALCAPLQGQSLYFRAAAADGIALLSPPLVSGSVEEAADLVSARAVFLSRTPAQEAQATHSSSLSFALFTNATGSIFHPGKLPKTDALLQQIKKGNWAGD